MAPVYLTFTAYMAAIDALLSGRADNLADKIKTLVVDLGCGRNCIWYVSDGGISRIVVQLRLRTLRLDGPPSQRAKDAWETREVKAAVREAEYVLGQLCESLNL